jgi:microcystin-dependent protein
MSNPTATQRYPIGSILAYGGHFTSTSESDLINAGFIPCDGRPLSFTDPKYQALKNVIGHSYGGDDTHFYVPDYRGRFLRGTDLGAGRDHDAGSRTAPNPSMKQPGNTGDSVGSVQPCALQQHTHGYKRHKDTHKIDYGGLMTPGVFKTNTSSGTSGKTPSKTNEGLETRPKNMNINYVIVYMA